MNTQNNVGARSIGSQFHFNNPLNSFSSSSLSNSTLANVNFFDIVSAESLKCPISEQLMTDPRTLVPCAHTFESHSIKQSFLKNNKKICPKCNEPYTKMIVNVALQKMLSALHNQLKVVSKEQIEIENLINNLPDIPGKEMVRIGVEHYMSGQKDQGLDIILEVLINISDKAHADQISELVTKLTESSDNNPPLKMLSASKETELLDAQIIHAEEVIAEEVIAEEDYISKPKNAKRPLDEVQLPSAKKLKLSGNESPDHSSSLKFDLDGEGEEEFVMAAIAVEDSSIAPRNIQSDLISAFKTKMPQQQLMSLMNESNVNSQDEEGNTPLHLVSIYCHKVTSVVNKLFEYGANVNQLNQNGDTPLHIAAQYGRTKVISDLINQGADATILNNQEKLPIDLATTQNIKNCF
jgi:ankyrin repeat protein/Nse-like zinc-finger protein